MKCLFSLLSSLLVIIQVNAQFSEDFSDGEFSSNPSWGGQTDRFIVEQGDRRAFDRIVEAGGYISAPTGTAPDANEIPIPKEVADSSMDAAACIGCGACVAACPNSAAQLFTSAKLHHLNVMPQGQPERWKRTEAMVETMEDFFGSCTNHGECHEACPKEIPLDFIAFMNRDYVKSKIKNRSLASQ